MKKIVALALVLSMVFALCACGSNGVDNNAIGEQTSNNTLSTSKEQFALRNGIHFGDSKETVKEKETTLKLKDDSSYLEYWGDIAGYTGEATFYFDDNGGLCDLKYEIETTSGRSYADTIYEKIEDSCNRQYGTPYGTSSSDIYFPLYGKAFQNYTSYLALVDWGLYKSAKMVDYTQWTPRSSYDNENVTIDLVMYYITTNIDSKYVICTSYHYYSDEELLSVYNDVVSERNSADSVF